MYYVTKEFTFDSAHYLNNYEGKCANMHGHLYKIQVSFFGEELDDCGMLIDFGHIKKIANEKIVDRYDHSLLNEKAPFSEYFNSTAENMSQVFYNIFQEWLRSTKEENDYWDRGVRCHSVKVWETPTSFAEYKEF